MGNCGKAKMQTIGVIQHLWQRLKITTCSNLQPSKESLTRVRTSVPLFTTGSDIMQLMINFN